MIILATEPDAMLKILLSLLCQLHHQVWNSLHCFSSSVCFTDKSFNTAWILLGTSLQKIIDTVDNSALSKKGVHKTYILVLLIKLDINDSVVKKLSIRGLFLKVHASIFRQTLGQIASAGKAGLELTFLHCF